MSVPAMQVHIVNRGGRRGGGRKKNMPRRNKKGQFVKGSGRKKNKGGGRRGGGRRKGGRRKNQGIVPEVVTVNRGGRRKNQGEGGFTLRSVLHGLPGAIGGRLWLAFAVRRWGDAWGTSVFGPPSAAAAAAGATPPPPSPFHGQQWTFTNYVIGLVAMWGGTMLLRRFRPQWAPHFWRAGIESMATRLVWTEGIARSKWGQETFGQLGQTQVLDDQNGNRWLRTPQGWVAMAGLQQERSLDGLEPARDLDGLREERGIDRYGRGIGGRRERFGHALPPGTDDTSARYHGAGSVSPYHYAYQSSY